MIISLNNKCAIKLLRSLQLVFNSCQVHHVLDIILREPCRHSIQQLVVLIVTVDIARKDYVYTV